MQKINKSLISAIVAMSENRVIGRQNQLPWHLPADLKHFKTITTGHPIIMGRKTYESIGKPLPNRTNIIISRDASYQAEGCIVTSSIHDAINAAGLGHANEIFIIGGAEIFKTALPLISRIYLTIVHHQVLGDVYFPELDNHVWQESMREPHMKDENNAYDYTFMTLERK